MRKPDKIIGSVDDPYLLRWYIIPRNNYFNIYLHKFLKSDDDRALHDHPWLFNASILLKGNYAEYTFQSVGYTFLKSRSRFAGRLSGFRFRWGKEPHRIKLIPSGKLKWGKIVEQPVWTLFITGPIVRQWGFYCPNGWRVWYKYIEKTDEGNIVGRGCE